MLLQSVRLVDLERVAVLAAAFERSWAYVLTGWLAMMLKSAYRGFLGLCVMAAATPAAAVDQIGSAVSVVNYVTAAYERDTRTLKSGDGVRQNELIEVGPKARSEIQLNDNTKLALGPGARLLLDKFVYDPDKTANAIILNMIEGTFRFITGVAQKPSYVIRTPSASITVRGTIFDVYVRKSGEAWVLLHEGGVKVCNGRGACRVMDEPGRLMPITETGELGNPVRWASLKALGTGFFDQAFPFVKEAPVIDPNPVFTREALLEAERASDAPAKNPAPRKTTESKPGDGKSTIATPPKKRPGSIKVVEQDADEGKVKRPSRPVRVVLPIKKRIKYVEEKEERRYDDRRRETGKKLIKAAAVGALIIGASRLRPRDYPKGGNMGEAPVRNYPSKSGLGGSMLR